MFTSWLKKGSLKRATGRSTLVVPGNSPRLLVLVSVMALFVGVGIFVVNKSRAASVVGDLNNDNTVNIFDLSILLSKWGTSDATADLTHDGTVNIFDLSTLLSHWGQTATPTPTPTRTPTPSPTATPGPTPSPSPTGTPPSRTTNCAPAASATMTNNVSHLCGFADATNTGIPAGTTLKRVPQDITAPDSTTGSGWHYDSRGWVVLDGGGILTNVKIDGADISVEGSGAIIKNSDLANPGSWAIALRHVNNTVINHNNIHGDTQTGAGAGGEGVRDIYNDSDNITITNNNFWFLSNPLNNICLGGLFQNNYAHDMSTLGDAHYEVLQAEPPGSSTPLILRDNTFLQDHTDQTASIILSNDGGGTENNRLIDHNLLAGGGYTFYGGGCATCGATNITFTNNHFSRIFAPNSGGYGPVAYWKAGGGNVWSGNIWDDTGAALSP